MLVYYKEQYESRHETSEKRGHAAQVTRSIYVQMCAHILTEAPMTRKYLWHFKLLF